MNATSDVHHGPGCVGEAGALLAKAAQCDLAKWQTQAFIAGPGTPVWQAAKAGFDEAFQELATDLQAAREAENELDIRLKKAKETITKVQRAHDVCHQLVADWEVSWAAQAGLTKRARDDNDDEDDDETVVKIVKTVTTIKTVVSDQVDEALHAGEIATYGECVDCGHPDTGYCLCTA